MATTTLTAENVESSAHTSRHGLRFDFIFFLFMLIFL